MTTHCTHSPDDIVTAGRTSWCGRCEEIARMDDTKHKRINETLDMWIRDGHAIIRDIRVMSHVVSLSPIEAVQLADWLWHEFLEVERPERIVPEQGDGPF